VKYLMHAIALLVVGWTAAAAAAPAVAQENQPAVIFEGLMDSYYGENDGLVSLDAYDLVFAPEGEVNAVVGVVNANGDVLAQFAVYPDYKVRDGVFGRVQVVGPADIQITEPGLYTLVFVVDGQAVTRFPFLVQQSGDGSDPYDPQKTYVFDGYWRTLAHITVDNINDEPRPVFTVWFMPVDLPAPDAFQVLFDAELYRDGALVAHAKKQTSSFGVGDFGREEILLYQPHEVKEEPNAIALTMADLMTDGQYELKVTRSEDGAALRDFTFTVADGQIVPLPRTQLGFEPATDFIAPRVLRKGSTVYEFEDAIWIAGE
jgi:hypothetical protein